MQESISIINLKTLFNKEMEIDTMERYEELVIEIVIFEGDDVITSSNETGDDDLT